MNSLLDYFKDFESITDPELRLTISSLRQKSGVSIPEDAAWYWENKTEVKLPSTNIADLEPFQYFNQAVELVLFSNRISDIRPLTNLPNLKHLNLIDNNIVFLDGISSLKTNELFLGSNLITDVTPLSNMSTLKILGLVNNQIKDLRPLESLIGLVRLNLVGNPLDISEVQSLKGKLPGCKIIF